MNKIILLVFALSICLISCNDANKSDRDVKQEIVEEEYDPKKVEVLFVEYKHLYENLLEIKDTPKFKKYGFGVNGPYNKWLITIQELKERPDSKQLIKKGVLMGDLELLGLSYATSKGKETEVTIKLNEIIKHVIDSMAIEKSEIIEKSNTSLEENNYEDLKRNYELFGKWLIKNSVINQQYTYEIYRKDKNFIGMIPEAEFKIYFLEKKGKNYYVKDNKFGEYFRIDSKMNMTLFDSEGDLTLAGFVATKVD
ncbi:MAG: hypothetical protein K9J37_13130 [Saprospiraceae bacterium]|nr:hypothetical protein [Saprospiraceae bacterium]MCF8250851.1 hypothetical protein [Saprospiraceae bacterium]MCF8280690.1 hypothetical protein [Bacteroidales bacterium]MCF8312748.1 hypothetical protein [Saprospiraceae bacterium]MCF8441195.1 hypothetical protein [Saprospiraceae bacterium]